jgi:hypothetical protein
MTKRNQKKASISLLTFMRYNKNKNCLCVNQHDVIKSYIIHGKTLERFTTLTLQILFEIMMSRDQNIQTYIRYKFRLIHKLYLTNLKII